MLRIGYVRLREPAPGSEASDGVSLGDAARDAADLRAAGCQVVRAEEPPQPGADPFATLHSILDFIGSGDELVVGRLDHLGASGRAMLTVLERLERRGASLQILRPDLSSRGPGGPALRAALEAVAAFEPVGPARARKPAATQEIRALQRAGVGPVEIARRLGVSRMTVWRKLRALEPCGG
ncbi:recombinase family protein [Phenylobacterium sp.]|uniref:recombinase family protein n=1 Tax=Phenylobacterium sp. TaxID=1871053 RepID=UPI002C9F93B6|nr:recombinase family protein [Phenylobacterium sp.]HLZ73694.1 recombinase family protein [Phenylobacterium sp.]